VPSWRPALWRRCDVYPQRRRSEGLLEGPSLGFDAGADGDRTMMLVYNLPATNAIFRRYGGVDGSAYLIGGFGMTALVNDDVYVVPIRTGLGARLGFNVSYLKFTEKLDLESLLETWNYLERPGAAARTSEFRDRMLLDGDGEKRKPVFRRIPLQTSGIDQFHDFGWIPSKIIVI